MNSTTVFKKLCQHLLDLEIWLVAIAMAASLISSRLLILAAITPAIFCLVRLLAYGRASVRTPSDIPILILLLMSVITIWVTALPEITSIQVLRLLSGIGFFYTIINWVNSSKRLRLIINGLLLAGFGLALLSPFTVAWSTKLRFMPEAFYQSFTLLVSDTIHPNVIAGSLALLIPLASGWLLFAWKDLRIAERLLTGTSLLLMIAVLGLSQSRGAWMAVFIVLGILPVLRWRWGFIFPLLGVVAVAFLVYTIGPTQIITAIISGGSVKGVEGRVEIWNRALYMLRDFPFTGIGMGSYTRIADAIYPFSIASPGSINHAHNLFLQVGVDLGIPGLLAWLAVFFISITNGFKSFIYSRQYKNELLMASGIALTSGIVAMALHGITDAVTWGMVRPAPLVWMFWAAAQATVRLVDENQNASTKVISDSAT